MFKAYANRPAAASKSPLGARQLFRRRKVPPGRVRRVHTGASWRQKPAKRDDPSSFRAAGKAGHGCVRRLKTTELLTNMICPRGAISSNRLYYRSFPKPLRTFRDQGLKEQPTARRADPVDATCCRPWVRRLAQFVSARLGGTAMTSNSTASRSSADRIAGPCTARPCPVTASSGRSADSFAIEAFALTQSGVK